MSGSSKTSSQIGEDKAEKNALTDKSARVRMELYDWLQCIVTAVICGLLIFVFVGRTISVDGISMMQTLKNNDRVVLSNLFYTPRNEDIIVFQTNSDDLHAPLVKRIIAIAGQTVYIDFNNGNVFVDGVLLNEERYINEITSRQDDFYGSVTVPEGFVFVMGDNRNNSTDSRSNSVGLIDTRQILGKVMFVLIPGTDDDGGRDWSRFGLVS